MRFPRRTLPAVMLASLLACCATRPPASVVTSPDPAPVPAEFMQSPEGPPEMADKGAETGETLAVYADALMDWGDGLARRLKALQALIREREAAH